MNIACSKIWFHYASIYTYVRKTESKYKNKLTAESCFHLHKILDSVILD